MKHFDFFKKEKDALHRIQHVIANAPDMNKEILKELIRQLGYPPKTEDYRFHVVSDYVAYWWDFVGQWAWEQKDIRGRDNKTIADELIAKTPLGVETSEYPDEGLVFTKNIRESDGSNLSFWAEVKYKEGKRSLWPSIMQIDTFGKLDGIDNDKMNVGFAFKQEEK